MMKETPRHAEMSQFPVKDNELHIGGIPVTRLTAQVGQTPYYAYDRQLITQRIAALRTALPKAIHLHYAIKANPMPAVVQHLAGLTDGLDVASLGEMRVALDTGLEADKISFAGPGKNDSELKAAVAAGIIVNLESPTELERLAEQGDHLGRKPVVSVRVNPDFELKTSGMKMGGGPKPFGVDAEKVPVLLKRIGQLGLDFRGFHIFSGSQNLRSEAIIEAQSKTFELAAKLSQAAPDPVQWLNIGGGLGIPYFPGEKRLELSSVADNLDNLLTQYAADFGQSEIVMELGRYLVGEAGVYVCQVVDIKESRGEKYLVTNGGLHHHLAASGNFGQVIRKNYPVALANKIEAPSTETVHVVGPLCTPLDILASNIELPEATVGDLVVVYQSGAYGFTASPERFLNHKEPIEVLV